MGGGKRNSISRNSNEIDKEMAKLSTKQNSNSRDYGRVRGGFNMGAKLRETLRCSPRCSDHYLVSSVAGINRYSPIPTTVATPSPH